MRNLKQKRIAFFLCLTGALFICLAFLLDTAKSTNNQISISKMTNFDLDPDPNEVYNHILVKIKPYKTFRLALKLYMDDGTDLWIYYAPTSADPSQEYEGGPIHIGLDAALIDKEWHLIDFDISLDLESFVVSELRSIQEVEILGNRFDLYYIMAYREFSDGSRSNIVIDDFSLPGQNLVERGWKSTTIDEFRISFDSEMHGYLRAEYTPETTAEDPNATEQPVYYYPYLGYGYPYGTSYYGGTTTYGGYYGGGYYGSGYYGGGYYGGGLYGGGYYGSGYYGGGYYGGGLYGGLGGYYGGMYGGLGLGLYGGGLYGGLGGYYGGMYGGLGLGLYGGGLYGLSTYYGGPIGLSGLFI